MNGLPSFLLFKMKKTLLLLIILLLLSQSLFGKMGIYSSIAVLTVTDIPVNKKIIIDQPLAITNSGDVDGYFYVSLVKGSEIESKEGFEDLPKMKWVRSSLWKKSGKAKKIKIKAGESIQARIRIKVKERGRYLAYIKIQIADKGMLNVQICPRIEIVTEK